MAPGRFPDLLKPRHSLADFNPRRVANGRAFLKDRYWKFVLRRLALARRSPCRNFSSIDRISSPERRSWLDRWPWRRLLSVLFLRILRSVAASSLAVEALFALFAAGLNRRFPCRNFSSIDRVSSPDRRSRLNRRLR